MGIVPGSIELYGDSISIRSNDEADAASALRDEAYGEPDEHQRAPGTTITDATGSEEVDSDSSSVTILDRASSPPSAGDVIASPEPDGENTSKAEQSPRTLDEMRRLQNEISRLLDKSSEPSREDGDNDEETTLKAALELAETVDIADITIRSIQDRANFKDYRDLLETATRARLDYGSFLVREGRLAEAQGLLIEAAVDSPRTSHVVNTENGAVRFADPDYENAFFEITRGNLFHDGQFQRQLVDLMVDLQTGDRRGIRDSQAAMRAMLYGDQGLSSRHSDLYRGLSSFMVDHQERLEELKQLPRELTPKEQLDARRASQIVELSQALRRHRTSEYRRQLSMYKYLKGVSEYATSYPQSWDRGKPMLDSARRFDPQFAMALDTIDWHFSLKPRRQSEARENPLKDRDLVDELDRIGFPLRDRSKAYYRSLGPIPVLTIENDLTQTGRTPLVPADRLQPLLDLEESEVSRETEREINRRRAGWRK